MAEVTAFRNNALPYPVYGAPWTVVFPLMDTTGELITGATCDSEVSKNGDTGADCTNEGTEITYTTATNKGMYYLILTAAEMTADIVSVTIHSATSTATSIVLYPRKLVTLASGTSQGGAVGYITLAASTVTFDDQFNGCLCVATIDTNVETRILQACTTADQQCTVTPNWNVAPDADDTYIIYLPEGMQVPQSDLTAVSKDTTAANNLELQYDGTGLSGDTYPATQSQVGSLVVGAGGISVPAESATITTGTQTLTYTSTEELDGTTHDVAADGGNTDFYYQFDVGITGIATEVVWEGYAQSNNDSYTIKGYDWVSAGFKQVGTVDGTNTSTIVERVFVFTQAMTGTAANTGKVRFQITSADGTEIFTDRVLCEYTAKLEVGAILHSGIAQSATSNTIVLDTGANATNHFYAHARVVISSGTGSEQERVIVEYTGSSKTAKIAPPWTTTPDATSAFEITPAIVHAETGSRTIKVGIAAAVTNTTITLDSDASSTNDFYNEDLVHIDGGTGEGQTRVITAYVGATKVATISRAWTTNPDTASEYIIEEGIAVAEALGATAKADVTTAVEADGGLMNILAEALVYKQKITEANGNTEIHNSAGVSQGTVNACYTSVTGTTQRLKVAV